MLVVENWNAQAFVCKNGVVQNDLDLRARRSGGADLTQCPIVYCSAGHDPQFQRRTREQAASSLRLRARSRRSTHRRCRGSRRLLTRRRCRRRLPQRNRPLRIGHRTGSRRCLRTAWGTGHGARGTGEIGESKQECEGRKNTKVHERKLLDGVSSDGAARKRKAGPYSRTIPCPGSRNGSPRWPSRQPRPPHRSNLLYFTTSA